MNTRDVVVRIVQPVEQAQPVKKLEMGALPVEIEKNFFIDLMHGLGLAAMVGLGLYLTVGFFNLGFGFKEIMVIVGLPAAVGLVTSYAIF